MKLLHRAYGLPPCIKQNASVYGAYDARTAYIYEPTTTVAAVAAVYM